MSQQKMTIKPDILLDEFTKLKEIVADILYRWYAPAYHGWCQGSGNCGAKHRRYHKMHRTVSYFGITYHTS